MDMKVITPLIVDDMTKRLVIERQLGTIDHNENQFLERQMVNQAAKCKTMSDINALLCEYHFLFIHEKNHGRSVVSIAVTQEYGIGLLTERISDDGKIMKTYDDFGGDYDEFTDYVMDRIDTDERRKIRKDWNDTGGKMKWQDYLLKRVNEKSYGKEN